MRRRLTGVLLYVMAGVMVVGGMATMTGTSAHARGSEKTSPSSGVRMQWHPTEGAASIGMKTASLSKVFDDANRKATYGQRCPGSSRNATTKLSVFWCFQYGDNVTPDWVPQGVTSDADAVNDENWNGHRGLMVSWYSKDSKGVRVTLLDTETKRYRHLLLVKPVENGKDYAPIPLHAGGIVWYGEKLYVADSFYGTRVFDLKHIYDLVADPHGDVKNKTAIGRGSGSHKDTFYAAGYRYVIPQEGAWRSEQKASKTCQDHGPMINSWMSLDRAAKPDRLIIGEYCTKNKEGNPNLLPGRVAAWTMRDHKLVAQDRWATPDEVLTMPRLNGPGYGSNVQGGATTDGGGAWFFNVSHKSADGELFKYVRFMNGWSYLGTKKTPAGPEDLTFRYRNTKRLLYSVTEYAGNRVIYARNTYSGW